MSPLVLAVTTAVLPGWLAPPAPSAAETGLAGGDVLAHLLDTPGPVTERIEEGDGSLVQRCFKQPLPANRGSDRPDQQLRQDHPVGGVSPGVAPCNLQTELSHHPLGGPKATRCQRQGTLLQRTTG